MKTVQFFVDDTDNQWITPENFMSVGHVYIKLTGPNLPEVTAGQAASGYYGFNPGGIHDELERYNAVVNSSNHNLVESDIYILSEEQYNSISSYISSQISVPGQYNAIANSCIDFGLAVYKLYNPLGSLKNIFSAEQLVCIAKHSMAASEILRRGYGYDYSPIQTSKILQLSCDWDPDNERRRGVLSSGCETSSQNVWVNGRSYFDENGIRHTMISDDLRLAPDTLALPRPACLETQSFTFGDPHLLSWDKSKYDAMQPGEHVMVKSKTDGFELHTRHALLGDSRTISVNTATAVKLPDGTVVQANLPLPGLTCSTDGDDTLSAPDTATPLIYAGPDNGNAELAMPGSAVFTDTPYNVPSNVFGIYDKRTIYVTAPL